MEKEVILNFLKQQLDQFAQMEDEKEAGMILLGMSDYLLEGVEKSPEVFTKNDVKSVRMAFLRCGKMGERLKKFYENYQEPVKESSARILSRIEECSSLIETNHKAIAEQEKKAEEAAKLEETLRESEKELLARSQELKETEERYRALQKEVADCYALQEKIQQGKEAHQELDAMRKQNEQIKQGILEEGFVDEKDFTDQLSELEKRGEQISKEFNRLLTGVLEDSDQLYQQLVKRKKAK